METDIENRLQNFKGVFESIEKELSTVIVGNSELIRLTLGAVFAGGHVLLEGAPGLGKTLLVKSLSQCLGLDFNRVQFTSDLMPSDITGTQVLTESASGARQFEFKPGPIFANVVLADEVNRAGPKTQSALLEAMEEKQVSVLGDTHKLPRPFFVLATQNPIELEGTYPLPEAQLDRFLIKLLVDPPNSQALKEILARTTGKSTPTITPVFDEEKAPDYIASMQSLVREVKVPPTLEDVLIGLIFALTPQSNSSTDNVSRFVRFGPGPRGAQSVMLLAKVLAILDGRANLAFEDLKAAILPALRHRLVLNYQAEAEGLTSDDLIEEVRDSK